MYKITFMRSSCHKLIISERIGNTPYINIPPLQQPPNAYVNMVTWLVARRNTGGVVMKISVESFINGNNTSGISKNALPEIKNPTVLSIIDEAVARNNKLADENLPSHDKLKSGDYNFR